MSLHFLNDMLCNIYFQGNKGEVVEKLQQVELNSNTLARNSILGNTKDASGGDQLLVCRIIIRFLVVVLDIRLLTLA